MFDQLLKVRATLAPSERPTGQNGGATSSTVRNDEWLARLCRTSPSTPLSSPVPCAWPSDPANSSPERRSRPRRTAG